jgi:hypothetical protein
MESYYIAWNRIILIKSHKIMNYNEFLSRIIDEGIDAAKSDYTDPKDKLRLDGSIAGFEACRGKQPNELVEVWQKANDNMNNAFHEEKNDYWWYRCFQLEVEWVCNVVTAMLMNEGFNEPLLSWLPTTNGVIKAATILGKTELV